METLTRAKSLKETVISPRAGVSDTFRTTLSVAAGRVTQIEFGGGGVGKARLILNGDQTVRVVVLNRGGSIVMDSYQRGTSAIAVPRNSSQAMLIGEGLTPAPANLGIERESILLALGNRQFAGHGCIVAVYSYFDLDVRPLDSLPGIDLFERATTLRVSFSTPVREEGALVLKLRPTVDRPGSAVEQVRWLGNGARFDSLLPVVSAGRIALVMSVRAPALWSVDIDLGPQWKLEGVVFAPRTARVVASEMQDDRNWDLIDDAMPVHPRGLSTSISLEAGA